MERTSPTQPPRCGNRPESPSRNTSELHTSDDEFRHPKMGTMSQIAQEDHFFKVLYYPEVRLLLEFISDDYKTMCDIEREILGKDEAESSLRRVSELEIIEKIKTETGPAYRLRPQAMITVYGWLKRLSGNSDI
jgi:hypothetical protein